jgi:plasmid stabilization system protein ParE
MVPHKIIWSELAINTYLSNIEYLESAWTHREIDNFIASVSDKIALLSLQPRIGSPTNKRKNVRKTLVHKNILLIYRHKPQKKEIELIPFFNTHQQPSS